jgi:hypothetical protein
MQKQQQQRPTQLVWINTALTFATANYQLRRALLIEFAGALAWNKAAPAQSDVKTA